MQPHHQFFTSLKHLEKRLRLENDPPPPSTVSPPPPPPPTDLANTTEQSDSLGTPIYLNSNPTNTNPSDLEESEAPREFLSASSDVPNENRSESDRTVDPTEKSSLDRDIELLMQLLCLSELDKGGGVSDLGCNDGFYGRIVGVKGPKSGKEVERLEGLVKYYLKGEKKEPLGLAHLLLGKAAFVHSGLGGFAFPSTINEFLQSDPPVD